MVIILQSFSSGDHHWQLTPSPTWSPPVNFYLPGTIPDSSRQSLHGHHSSIFIFQGPSLTAHDKAYMVTTCQFLSSRDHSRQPTPSPTWSPPVNFYLPGTTPDSSRHSPRGPHSSILIFQGPPLTIHALSYIVPILQFLSPDDHPMPNPAPVTHLS